MSEKLKRTFETLDEAMSLLPKKTFEHSVRVASYMKVLFLQTCMEEDFYPNDEKIQARLKEGYSDLAYQIGYYHDIGKAKLPEEYQNDNPDYSREERALYEKHAADSMAIMEELYQKEHKVKYYEENWVREAIAFHHEEWGGGGFPNHLNTKSIPFFARLLKLADTMDHLFCETHSENPFNETMTYLTENADNIIDPALIPVLKHASGKIKRIFRSNIEDTRIIPEITAFVTKNADRPCAMFYTPVERFSTGEGYAVEADIRFKTKKLWLTYADTEFLIRREHLRKDLGIYAMLEACDALRRFDTCGIENEYMAVSLPSRWFNHRPGAAAAILECMKQSYVDPARIMFVLGKNDFRNARATLLKNLKALNDAGCGIMLDQLILDGVPVLPPPPAEDAPADPDAVTETPKPELIAHDRKKENGIITLEEILAIKPRAYRIGPADAAQSENDEYVAALKKISESGVMMVAKDIEARDFSGLFFDLKVETVMGKFAGESRTADDYVKTELKALDSKSE